MAEQEEKKVERKKASWVYSLVSHMLEVTFPDGVKGHFDLSKVTVGMPQTQELGFQYGIKQWLASNTADPKVYSSSKEKLIKMKEDYEGLIEHGLELRGEGKIGVIGRERSNAGAPRTQDRAVETALNTTLSREEVQSMLTSEKLGIIKLSEEMKAKLAARLEELKHKK